jgi:guanylate kinase
VPPSFATLRERLERRAADIGGEIAARLDLARQELAEGAHFDYAVVNDELERCVGEVLAILAAERAGDTARLRERHAPGPVIANLLRNR